jgi:hypothetical protein
MTWQPEMRSPAAAVRFGLAGCLVVVCALAGLGSRCGDMPGTDFLALALLLLVQGTTALGSFVRSALAGAKRDWRRARGEAFVGLAMLLAIPLAAFSLFSLAPSCAC